MKLKAASIGLLASAMVCAPLSEASAHGFRHHGHWLLFAPFEAVGAVVAGVAAIATAPIVLLADAVDGPGYDHRAGYYERHGDYYGRGAPYGRQGSNDYSDPRASDNGLRDYNYGPRDAYAAPPQDYGAPSDPYRGERNYYPPRSAYNAPPRREYRDRSEYYPPRDAYNAPAPGQYGEPPAQYPPPSYRPQSDDDRGSPDESAPPSGGD